MSFIWINPILLMFWKSIYVNNVLNQSYLFCGTARHNLSPRIEAFEQDGEHLARRGRPDTVAWVAEHESDGRNLGEQRAMWATPKILKEVKSLYKSNIDNTITTIRSCNNR
jgi:hypothetical protein